MTDNPSVEEIAEAMGGPMQIGCAELFASTIAITRLIEALYQHLGLDPEGGFEDVLDRLSKDSLDLMKSDNGKMLFAFRDER